MLGGNSHGTARNTAQYCTSYGSQVHLQVSNVASIVELFILSSFCIELKGGEHAPLLHPYLPYFITELCQMASETSESILFIVLDVLHEILKVCISSIHSFALIYIYIYLSIYVSI